MRSVRGIKFCGKQVSEEEISLIVDLTNDFWGIPEKSLPRPCVNYLNGSALMGI